MGGILVRGSGRWVWMEGRKFFAFYDTQSRSASALMGAFGAGRL